MERQSRMHGIFFYALLMVGISGSSASWANSGVAPQVLILPQGPGSLGGVGENVEVNLNMGAMSYRIPLKFPGGRNGHTPSLSLNYSSASGAGLAGMGWSMSAGGSVERLTVRGLPRYGTIQDPVLSGEDRFYSGTELIKISATPFYRTRFEGGFSRFRWHHTGDQKGYWTAEHPDGSISFFGASYKVNAQRKVDVSQGEVDLNSQVYGSLGTFRWELRSHVDPNGNQIKYSYTRDGSQVYLESIEWVFSEKGEALYKAELIYETRPDPYTDGKAGFELSTEKRLKEVRIFSTGQPHRSYRLEYDQTSRLSRLERVTQYGTDDKTAHPIRFTMKYSSADYDAKNSKMVELPTSLSQNFIAGNSDMVDMNGDGLPDVIDTSQSTHRFHLNQMTVKDLKQNTHDFAKGVDNPRQTSGAQLSSKFVQMLDYNGDGFTDLVNAVTNVILINKGNGKWEDQSPKLLGTFPSPGENPNRRFFDYNGDKAIDVMEIIGDKITYWVSDGKGEWKKSDATETLGVDFATDRLQLIDINGDGLMDAVQIYEGKVRYKKYFGYGRWSKDWIVIPVTGLTQSLADKVQFSDVNGDGMADMVAFIGSTIKFFVNLDGRSFAAGQDLTQKFQGIDIPETDPSKITVRIADINGNGSRDIIWLDSSGKVKYLELFSLRPNLLTQIDNGIGMRMEVTYGSSVYHYLRDQAAGSAWRSKLPMPYIVVNEIKTWASRDKANPGPDKACPKVQRIYYHDGYYDGEEKQFRGFRRVESVMLGDKEIGCQVDSIGKRTEMMHYYVGDGDTQSGDNDRYYHGKPREQTTTGTTHENKEITFSSKKWEWQDCTVSGSQTTFEPKIRYICLKSEETTLQEGETDKTKWKTLRTEYEYDGYGNTIVQKLLGEKDKEGDEKYSKTTYITPKDPNDSNVDARWFLRATQRNEICTTLNGPCATTEYFYDGEPFVGLPAGQITRGNLSRMSAKPAADAEVIHIQRRKYDAYGNPIESMNPLGHRSTYEWDPDYHRFPIKESHILKDSTLTYTTQWDLRFGTVQQSTDYNGNSTFYQYDTFGRVVSFLRPGDDPSAPSEVFEYNYQEPISTIVSRRRSQKGSDFDIEKILCFDGMGRQLQTRYQLGPNRYAVSGHKVYNNRNLAAQTAQSYETDQRDCQLDIPAKTPITSSYYDGKERPLRTVVEDGSFSLTFYHPFLTVFHDLEDTRQGSPYFNTPTSTYTDGLGRTLKRVEMDKAGHEITTQFKWTFLNIKGTDKIAEVTDATGNTKYQSYDLLGRTTEVKDPDRKTIQYTYDAASNIIRRKDERGISIVSTFDELNRTQTIQEDGKPETLITFAYDKPQPGFPSATQTASRLSAVSHPNGKEFMSYDARGRVIGQRREFLGRTFDVTMAYDNLDRPTETTYPDGRKLTYQFDKLERLVSISGIVKQITYAPDGTTQSWTFENGLKTTLTHDQRLRPISFQVQDGKLFSLKYEYDAIGNITTLERSLLGQTQKQSFAYDALYRLTQAQLSDQETMSYKYDDIGNIVAKSSSLQAKSPAHVGEYTYDPNRPRAVSKAGNDALTYDPAGQLLKDAQHSYTWDYQGRLTEIKAGDNAILRSWYGAARDRVAKLENGKHTFYIAQGYEIRDGVAELYVYLGKARVAVWKSTQAAKMLFDDLAPAKGTDTITAAPDGQINAGDAWLYYAGRNKLIKLDVPTRTPDIDLTRDMLAHRLNMMLQPEATEEKIFFHTNAQNSTLLATDAKGQPVATQTYYPYGTTQTQTGMPLHYGYTGLERDTSTQLYYANARYLNTRLARWTSPDPAFDQIRGLDDEFNSYWYGANNPLRFIDQTGTEIELGWNAYATASVVMIAIGAIATIASIKTSSTTAGRWAAGAVGAIGMLGSLTSLAVDVIKGQSEYGTILKWVGASVQIGASVGALVVTYYEYQKGNATTRELTERRDSATRRATQAEQRADHTERRLEHTTTQLTRTETQHDLARSELADLRNQLRTMRGELTKAEEKASTLQRQNSGLKKDVSSLRTELKKEKHLSAIKSGKDGLKTGKRIKGGDPKSYGTQLKRKKG